MSPEQAIENNHGPVNEMATIRQDVDVGGTSSRLTAYAQWRHRACDVRACVIELWSQLVAAAEVFFDLEAFIACLPCSLPNCCVSATVGRRWASPVSFVSDGHEYLVPRPPAALRFPADPAAALGAPFLTRFWIFA